MTSKENIFSERSFWGRFGVEILTAVLFLVRLALIWKSPDIISVPEELYQGYVALENLSGLKVSLLHYQPDAYTAGSVITGTLAVPFFAVFGKSLFALKMVPLLFLTGAFWITLRILKILFNLETALAIGLLIIFSPPGFSALSVMALGSHPEARFFLMAMLLFVVRCLQNPNQATYLLAGLFAGIACWYGHMNIPATILCACLLAINEIRGKRRVFPFLFFIMGGLVGVAPRLIYNATHHWEGIRFLYEHSQPALPGPIWLQILRVGKKALRLATVHFPQALFFQSRFNLPAMLFNYLYTAVLFLGYFAFVIIGIKRKMRFLNDFSKRLAFLFFMIFPVLFWAIYAYVAPSFSWHYAMVPYRFRYFIPLFYFLLISVGIMTVFLKKFRSLYFLLLILGVLGQWTAFSYPSSVPTVDLPGYFLESPSRVYRNACVEIPFNLKSPKLISRDLLKPFFFYCEKFWQKKLSAKERVDLANSLSDDDRHTFYVQWGRFQGALLENPWEQTLGVPGEIPDADRKFYVYGLTREIDWAGIRSAKIILEFIERQPELYRVYYMMGMGSKAMTWITLSGPPYLQFPEIRNELERASAPTRQWISRGMGQALLWTIESKVSFEHLLNYFPVQIDASVRDQILWGIGWELRERRGPLSLPHSFSALDLAAIKQGYEANLAWVHGKDVS